MIEAANLWKSFSKTDVPNPVMECAHGLSPSFKLQQVQRLCDFDTCGVQEAGIQLNTK